MGHPYARYWSEDSGPHPDEYVHRQSSNLYDNIEQVVKMDGNMVISAVGVDEKKVEYIGYLIWGTVFMRSRDFLGHAWVAVRNPFMKILQYGLSSKTGSRGSKR
jgi:hypothetical protein